MSVLVLGSVNTDLVIQSAQLPSPGETVLGGQFYRAAGGKGANQAVAAARASLSPVTFLAAVGDDSFGQESLQTLATENLETCWIKTVPGVASGVALILVNEAGENLISVASGANFALLSKDVTELPSEVFETASVFLTCLESPLDTVLTGLRRAKESGVLTILNPAPAQQEVMGTEVLSLVDVLTPNEHELSALTNQPCDTEAECQTAAQSVLKVGCPQVIVTRGAAGSLCVNDAMTESVSALQVDAVDATGAGDTFNGVLAVGLSEGLSMSQAVRRANLAASLSVRTRGAQPSLPTRSAIDAALSEFED